MIKLVLVLMVSLGMTLGVTSVSAKDHNGWNNGQQKHKSEWQVREERRQRQQAQWERDQERQRQQQEELRCRAEQQRLRDEAWQRQQEAELRRRAEQQRRKADARQHQRNNSSGYSGRQERQQHWERGQRYSGHHYSWVSDWNRHQLRIPGHGQRWVHNESGQYLLLETATDLILDIFMR